MYKILRRLFPRWYYKREFLRLQGLLLKLDTPCFTPHIPEVYAHVFFGSPCNIEHLRPGVEESMSYLRDVAEENKFDKMHDFRVYYRRMSRRTFRKAKQMIKESEKYD
jgi:hypothetical protein